MELSSGILPSLALVALLAAAAWCDVQTGKIPNRLTLATLGCGLGFRAIEGSTMVMDGVLGAALGLAIGLLLFSISALGAGDGKLLIGVGAFFGVDRFIGALMLIAVLGGLLGVAVAVRRGVIIPALLNAGRLLRRCLTFGRSADAERLTSPSAGAVPYGVAIATGALIWWFWGGSVL